MTDDDPGTRRPPASQESNDASLNAETIKKLLHESVPGAQELDENLRKVFGLSESTASLRLK